METAETQKHAAYECGDLYQTQGQSGKNHHDHKLQFTGIGIIQFHSHPDGWTCEVLFITI